MRRVLTIWFILAFAVTAIVGCQVFMAKPKTPVIKLNRVEVAHYWKFFLEPKKKRGSTLDLAFIFDITNSNSYKVMLDEFRFTVAFEGIELSTPIVYEDVYIPGKTTSQLRVHVALDAYTALLALLVPPGNVQAWKKMGTKPPALLKKWWEGIQDFSFPIEVRNGVAKFSTPKGEIIAPFKGVFPKKK